MLRFARLKEGSGLGDYLVEVRDGWVDAYYTFYPNPKHLTEHRAQHIYFCRRGVYSFDRSTVLIEKESWQTRSTTTGRFYTKCEKRQERRMLREKAVQLYEKLRERLRSIKYGTHTVKTLFKVVERTFNEATGT